MGKVINITGLVFGKLTVIKKAGLLDGRAMFWHCKCLCGNEKIANGQLLRNGHVKSCGCFQSESARERNTKHSCGKKGFETPEYIAWRAMIQRINSKSYHARDRYSERGITICDRWRHSFENFLLDMGEKPSKNHSLDRFPDKDGNYGPENCRWATMKEQNGNKKNNVWIEWDNKKMILSDWARYFGIAPTTLSDMMKKKSFDLVYKHYIKKI